MTSAVRRAWMLARRGQSSSCSASPTVSPMALLPVRREHSLSYLFHFHGSGTARTQLGIDRQLDVRPDCDMGGFD